MSFCANNYWAFKMSFFLIANCIYQKYCRPIKIGQQNNKKKVRPELNEKSNNILKTIIKKVTNLSTTACLGVTSPWSCGSPGGWGTTEGIVPPPSRQPPGPELARSSVLSYQLAVT